MRGIHPREIENQELKAEVERLKADVEEARGQWAMQVQADHEEIERLQAEVNRLENKVVSLRSELRDAENREAWGR